MYNIVSIHYTLKCIVCNNKNKKHCLTSFVTTILSSQLVYFVPMPFIFHSKCIFTYKTNLVLGFTHNMYFTQRVKLGRTACPTLKEPSLTKTDTLKGTNPF